MPRRGWVAAPDGWLQFIRGPGPLAHRWPPAKGRFQAAKQPGRVWVKTGDRFLREFRQHVGAQKFGRGPQKTVIRSKGPRHRLDVKSVSRHRKFQRMRLGRYRGCRRRCSFGRFDSGRQTSPGSFSSYSSTSFSAPNSRACMFLQALLGASQKACSIRGITSRPSWGRTRNSSSDELKKTSTTLARSWVVCFSHSNSNHTALVLHHLTELATFVDWSTIICCHSCAACVKMCETLATSGSCPATNAACRSLCRSSIHSCISSSK